MKKIVLASAGFLVAVAAFAQASVTSAFNANKAGEYVKAMEYIEQAIQNPKAIAKEKTWRYRGMIYTNIAKDSLLALTFPNAVPTALESFNKSNELDTRNDWEEKNNIAISQLQAIAGNSGINAFNAGDYPSAAKYFLISSEVAAARNVIDTAAIFNAALSYERADMKEEAIENYMRAGDLGYGANEEAQASNYSMAIRLMKDAGMGVKATETLKMAREKFPNDQALIIEELNDYLKDGNFEEAEKNLQAAVEKDPNNANMRYAMGVVYDNLDKDDKAEAAYLKAIELKDDYFDPNYNLGALYYNQAVNKIAVANEIPLNQKSKYDAALKEANATFESALPYLEKAHMILPDDIATMESLKQIYARQSKTEEMMEMDKKIQAAKG